MTTKRNKLIAAIKKIEDAITDAKIGLPDEIFFMITRLTPMVNVDLLIKDNLSNTLLAWREIDSSGAGWHIPGGIIRYKEDIEDRIKQVALREIGTVLGYDPIPIAINQVMQKKDTRGHFISILYKCFWPMKKTIDNKKIKENKNGFLKWHKKCPKNLVKVHKLLYTKFFENETLDYFQNRIPVSRFNSGNSL